MGPPSVSPTNKTTVQQKTFVSDSKMIDDKKETEICSKSARFEMNDDKKLSPMQSRLSKYNQTIDALTKETTIEAIDDEIPPMIDSTLDIIAKEVYEKLSENDTQMKGKVECKTSAVIEDVELSVVDSMNVELVQNQNKVKNEINENLIEIEVKSNIIQKQQKTELIVNEKKSETFSEKLPKTSIIEEKSETLSKKMSETFSNNLPKTFSENKPEIQKNDSQQNTTQSTVQPPINQMRVRRIVCANTRTPNNSIAQKVNNQQKVENVRNSKHMPNRSMNTPTINRYRSPPRQRFNHRYDDRYSNNRNRSYTPYHRRNDERGRRRYDRYRSRSRSRSNNRYKYRRYDSGRCGRMYDYDRSRNRNEQKQCKTMKNNNLPKIVKTQTSVIPKKVKIEKITTPMIADVKQNKNPIADKKQIIPKFEKFELEIIPKKTGKKLFCNQNTLKIEKKIEPPIIKEEEQESDVKVIVIEEPQIIAVVTDSSPSTPLPIDDEHLPISLSSSNIIIQRADTDDKCLPNLYLKEYNEAFQSIFNIVCKHLTLFDIECPVSTDTSLTNINRAQLTSMFIIKFVNCRSTADRTNNLNIDQFLDIHEQYIFDLCKKQRNMNYKKMKEIEIIAKQKTTDELEKERIEKLEKLEKLKKIKLEKIKKLEQKKLKKQKKKKKKKENKRLSKKSSKTYKNKIPVYKQTLPSNMQPMNANFPMVANAGKMDFMNEMFNLPTAPTQMNRNSSLSSSSIPILPNMNVKQLNQSSILSGIEPKSQQPRKRMIIESANNIFYPPPQQLLVPSHQQSMHLPALNANEQPLNIFHGNELHGLFGVPMNLDIMSAVVNESKNDGAGGSSGRNNVGMGLNYS